jgi:uncharacterized membrane protein
MSSTPAAPDITGALPVAGPLSATPSPRRRLGSIDLLRGIVMVVMALDHVRDFVFAGTLQFNATDFTQTTPEIFFTRWVTHFCAPVFVFLAGTGSYLQRTRGKSVDGQSWFLLTRGLWLIVLEFTIVRFGITFDLSYQVIGLPQVIWVIGVGMILLAGLVRLPTFVAGTLGVGVICLHNLLDRFPTYQFQGAGSAPPTLLQAVWALLHGIGILPVGQSGHTLVVLYAILPWFGVMAAGFAFGSVYTLAPNVRRRVLLQLGGAAVVAFLVLRTLNGYGDPNPWAHQAIPRYTALSFLNVSKYPPSLDFVLMTLGPAILALAWFERVNPSGIAAPLITLGRVPMFFYLLQWFAAHGIAVAVVVALHQKPVWLFWHTFPPPQAPPGSGVRLRTTYLIWFAVIVLLYPLCRWHAGVKARRRDWWLSYI